MTTALVPPPYMSPADVRAHALASHQRVVIPAPSTATTYDAADQAVRRTAHLLANTWLPIDRRHQLVDVHQANLNLRASLLDSTGLSDRGLRALNRLQKQLGGAR